MSGKTTFICHLRNTVQTQLSKDIKAALKANGTYSAENLAYAMDGRLCDIEDLIDITPYLEKELVR